jgi:hypothetical protein
MVRKVQAGGELPMPVVILKADGALRLAGGATRVSIASLAGQKVRALVFDAKRAFSRQLEQKKKYIQDAIARHKISKELADAVEKASREVDGDELAMDHILDEAGFEESLYREILSISWSKVRELERKIAGGLSESTISEDFKTSAKKFVDQGIDKSEVDQYFSDFKKMKDIKIKDIEDKNIDNWSKKPWDEFKIFVDKLKSEKTKSELKKQEKMEGAKLVAENDKWFVYEINDFDSCRMYGSGTKWCITNKNGLFWNEYKKRNNFYFLISKTLPKEDKFYKIAVQVDPDGTLSYWDATDKEHSSVPSDLDLPKFSPIAPEFWVGINGKKYTINDLENAEGLVTDDTLALGSTRVKKLPKNLTVNGDLHLSDTPITHLPSGLRVNGDLWLNHSKLVELPNDLKVNGSLHIGHTAVRRIPSGIEIGGDLDVMYSDVKEIDSDIKIGGDITGFKGKTKK